MNTFRKCRVHRECTGGNKPSNAATPHSTATWPWNLGIKQQQIVGSVSGGLMMYSDDLSSHQIQRTADVFDADTVYTSWSERNDRKRHSHFPSRMDRMGHSDC